MTVTVKFFARLREQVGHSEITLTITEPLTVEQVWMQVCDDMPFTPNILAAVNLEYVKRDVLVQANDEVAFFPPVTGG